MAEILLRAEDVPADLGWAFQPVGGEARDVFTIPTEPTPFAHFATWPRKLVARMILAGTSERGCCPECGAPWTRDTEVGYETSRQPGAWNDGGYEGKQRLAYATHGVATKKVTTLGWSPSCAHDHTPIPAIVLDPFAGSGTTLLVARQHGRRSVGIELNETYCQLAAGRLAQQSLLTELA